jgi:hypothetical protein
MSTNRIPPEQDLANLERPAITEENITLTADEKGFLRIQWITPGKMYYQEKYHVATYARQSWNLSQNPIRN